MTDEKPMTFEEALRRSCAAEPDEKGECKYCNAVRAAHAREIEVARREEREACAALARLAPGIAAAILARGKL